MTKISRIEYARQWKLPLYETHKIFAFADKHHMAIPVAFQTYKKINEAFAACVGQHQETKKYVGVLYRYDAQHRPNIAFTTKEYDTYTTAAKNLNKTLNEGQLNFSFCYSLDVLPEALCLIQNVKEQKDVPSQKSATITMVKMGRGARN